MIRAKGNLDKANQRLVIMDAQPPPDRLIAEWRTAASRTAGKGDSLARAWSGAVVGSASRQRPAGWRHRGSSVRIVGGVRRVRRRG